MSDLRQAAQALIDRWDTPAWKDAPHTAEFIDRLRVALARSGQAASGSSQGARSDDQSGAGQPEAPTAAALKPTAWQMRTRFRDDPWTQWGECADLRDGEALEQVTGPLTMQFRPLYAHPPARSGADPAAALEVACHECSECGHIGINDESDTESACARCRWHGPSPDKDVCPGCSDEGTMCSACPKCGGYYTTIAETLCAHPARSGAGSEEAQPDRTEES